ncbi:Sensor kinase CckA [subsurface metagenome]
MGILAGGIAHDFNNILTVILGNISLARISTDQDIISSSLEEAEQASIRAEDLTRQLLTFSKGGSPIKKTVPIEELIRESAGFALRGSNVKCEYSIPEDLWPADVDEGQVIQVIGNLVINADQAMPEGGVIKVSSENVNIRPEDAVPVKNGEYVKISIKDRGIGIAREHLEKIFDPYFTTKQKGSGLGLSISYSIIRNHDGHIDVESYPGLGSTFHIYIPASPEKAGEKKEKEEEKPLAGTGKILVMDDEEMIRRFAGKCLKHIGYGVTLAKEGAGAVKLYKDARDAGKPFDIVILDLTVPGGMGGEEALKKLIEIDPEVKALVSSGYSDAPVMANYREFGFCGVIAKPYEIKELNENLNKLLDKP